MEAPLDPHSRTLRKQSCGGQLNSCHRPAKITPKNRRAVSSVPPAKASHVAQRFVTGGFVTTTAWPQFSANAVRLIAALRSELVAPDLSYLRHFVFSRNAAMCPMRFLVALLSLLALLYCLLMISNEGESPQSKAMRRLREMSWWRFVVSLFSGEVLYALWRKQDSAAADASAEVASDASAVAEGAPADAAPVVESVALQ
jgi:hypothetical protein